jgi:hypothetical protein
VKICPDDVYSGQFVVRDDDAFGINVAIKLADHRWPPAAYARRQHAAPGLAPTRWPQTSLSGRVLVLTAMPVAADTAAIPP